MDKLVKDLRDRLVDWEIDPDRIIYGIRYLRRFGYLKKLFNLELDEVIEAIRLFQAFTGWLKQDGQLGPKTLEVMNMPRCQVPDIQEVTESYKWRKNELTWYISRRDNDMTAAAWDAAISKAFLSWSDVADLKFTRSNSARADIVLSTGQGRRDGFDGQGGTLAWMQLPRGNNYDGSLLGRFDVGESWLPVGSNQRGILLENVACHEIGHALGLVHSRVSSALMAPFYSRNISRPQARDDVQRIQKLYGKPSGPPNDPTTKITIKGNVSDIDIEGYRVIKIG